MENISLVEMCEALSDGAGSFLYQAIVEKVYQNGRIMINF